MCGQKIAVEAPPVVVRDAPGLVPGQGVPAGTVILVPGPGQPGLWEKSRPGPGTFHVTYQNNHHTIRDLMVRLEKPLKHCFKR